MSPSVTTVPVRPALKIPSSSVAVASSPVLLQDAMSPAPTSTGAAVVGVLATVAVATAEGVRVGVVVAARVALLAAVEVAVTAGVPVGRGAPPGQAGMPARAGSVRHRMSR